MTLSCDCDLNTDFFCEAVGEFMELKGKHCVRCLSCSELIGIGSICLKFVRGYTNEDGDEHITGHFYYCESCGDLFCSLEDLGFCIVMNENMHEVLEEYHDIYGQDKGEKNG